MLTPAIGAYGRDVAPTNRIFVLGAGFSAAAGLPLANDLLPKIFNIEEKFFRVNGYSHLRNAINQYSKYLLETSENNHFSIEDFAAWLDWEHTLELKGSDTYSDHANEPGLQLRWAIGKILNDQIPTHIPDVYLDFAQILNTSDRIITLNYDLLVERSLSQVGVPYRRFPDRFSEVNEYYGTVDNDQPQELVLSKLHGSIDWSYMKDTSWSKMPPLLPLTEGVRFHEDPLLKIGVIQEFNIKDYYSKTSYLYEFPPLLFPPSSAKPLGKSPLIPIWRGIGMASNWYSGLNMIGCSLPPGDPYVKQLIYQIATEFTLSDKDFFGNKKRRMKVVTLQSTSEQRIEYKKRTKFFNPKKTDYYFEGLSSAVIQELT